MAAGDVRLTLYTGFIQPVNGASIYYEIDGQGEPLVLLHGFTGCGGNWSHFGRNWRAGFQAIMPDLRGHGRSTNPSAAFTHRQAALDVFSILDRLQIGKFKGVGLSCGGNVLLHMATMQPERVDAMVIVSPTTHYPEQARAMMRAYSTDQLTVQAWADLRARHAYGDDQIRALYAQGRAFADDFDDLSFTPAQLSAITARTLIVYGDRDPLYPVEIAVEMYRSIPRSSLWVVPGGGHGPVFGEMAGQFTERARKFLHG